MLSSVIFLSNQVLLTPNFYALPKVIRSSDPQPKHKNGIIIGRAAVVHKVLDSVITCLWTLVVMPFTWE